MEGTQIDTTNTTVNAPQTNTVTDNTQQSTEQIVQEPGTQTPQGTETSEENNQGNVGGNIEPGATPPPAPTQEEYDKLQERLKEYELSENEMAQLKQRLGVDEVDYSTNQIAQTLDIIQNQAQQEYIRLCNKYGVDYRPEAIEASSKALLEKDPKAYYELQTNLDRLNNAYTAKQTEVQNYMVQREIGTFYQENQQLLQASPVLNNLINEYVQTSDIRYVNKASLDDLLSRAKSIYAEAFDAGMRYSKLNTQTNPGDVLNTSVATTTQQSYPTQSGQKVWTRAEISQMSDSDFRKNQKSIEEAMVKGLIK